MASEKIRIAVVACPQCGAPMHPDAAHGAFFCPYCDHVMPYSAQALAGMRPLVYKHREIPVEDGLLKLIRVAVLTGVADDLRDSTDPGEAHVRWARSFDDYVAAIDRRAYVTRRDRFEFTFVCPHCAAPVPGSSTQTMYECESCGSVFGLNDMAAMGLDKMPQIVGNESMVPTKCLPFKLGRVQAEGRIRYLASLNPGFFDGFDLDGMLRQGDLTAVYTPVQLCDLALRVTTRSNLGEAEFYMEWVDWTLPRDTGLDLVLLDRMQPWDFNEAGVFLPDLVVGDVVICAATNFANKLGVINAIAARTAREEIQQRYGAERLQLVRWSHDLTEHQSALTALPVFYLEAHDGAGGGLRVMVNGQTGAAQAVARVGGREFSCGIPGTGDGRFDGERTMRSAPVPVRYEKPSHLYRVLTREEAFGRRAGKAHSGAGNSPKRKGLLGRLFS